jgi:hypothetical protein
MEMIPTYMWRGDDLTGWPYSKGMITFFSIATFKSL